jgi:hypothetical protein
LTVKVWPAIVNVPERAPPLFAAALYWTVPLPLPLPPDVTVSQDALLPAVHEHPPPADTATLPVPPPAAALPLVGEIENEQPLP